MRSSRFRVRGGRFRIRRRVGGLWMRRRGLVLWGVVVGGVAFVVGVVIACVDVVE